MTKKLVQRSMLVVLSTLVAVCLAELGLRVMSPNSFELHLARDHTVENTLSDAEYTVDPEFGFRPVLGRERYTLYGTRRNEYSIEKPPDVERLLFAGDSVTARGYILDALKQFFSDGFEYWNAGVESFSTVQELAYYKHYNAAVKPDHVVLTFHLNDFRTTPAAFRNDSGELVVYAPDRREISANDWFYRNSVLYRSILRWAAADATSGPAAFAGDVARSLRGFRDVLDSAKIRFTVLVFPILLPKGEWTEADNLARRLVLDMLTEIGIEHYDLAVPIFAAIEKGVEIQKPAGDPWHPSREAADQIAAWLHGQGWAPGANGPRGALAGPTGGPR